MDRVEATGLAVATVGHVALLAAITYGLAATRLPVPKSDPIEVAFVDEAGLESTSPTPSAAEPAPLAGPEDGPPAPAMPAPPQIQQVPAPQPQALPQPQPQQRASAPKPVAAPQPRPAPPKASATPKPRPASPKPSPAPATKAPPRRNASGLDSVVAGLSDRPNSSRSTIPPAAAAGPQVEASLVAEVRRQVKPHWQRAVPTGADAEALRTQLSLTLARDGRVTDIDVLGTTGVTASNRPQVALHQERAKKAVTLASPFNLPDKYYDAWKQLNVTLDLRLSQ